MLTWTEMLRIHRLENTSIERKTKAPGGGEAFSFSVLLQVTGDLQIAQGGVLLLTDPDPPLIQVIK